MPDNGLHHILSFTTNDLLQHFPSLFLFLSPLFIIHPSTYSSVP
ncbi:hypothetical protein ACHAXS_000782, partial [Conticribra weissflogii]